MRYKKKLYIRPALAKRINRYLFEEPKDEKHCLGEDDTIVHTAIFDNGIEIDIKCCGVQYQEGECNLAWTEAVLFENGHEVCCSEPCDDYFDEWLFEYKGDEYSVYVTVDTH